MTLSLKVTESREKELQEFFRRAEDLTSNPSAASGRASTRRKTKRTRRGPERERERERERGGGSIERIERKREKKREDGERS